MPDEKKEKKFTKDWTPSKPIWATVIRCPRCNALIDDDWANCRECGLEVKHETISLGIIRVLARDPEYVQPSIGVLVKKFPDGYARVNGETGEKIPDGSPCMPLEIFRAHWEGFEIIVYDSGVKL